MPDAPPPPTAADHLCYALADHGVEVMFGHPGGAILPLYDALHRTGVPRHVLMRHEQGAAHAADGYARATGRVGVCVATSGPGATNLVTGLATAMMDGVAVVAITGQVPMAGRGLDSFQESDILGITMPITKHGFSVEDPDAVCEIVAEAFALAQAGRPGPVLIDIPKDVQAAGAKPRGVGLRSDPAPAAPVDEALVRSAAQLLNRAARPVIMVGRGVVLSQTGAWLQELAERAQAPVVTTLLGLDAFPASHPLAIGLPGMHGTERANHAIQAADVVIGLGLRFDDRVIGRSGTFAPHATIVHADIHPGAVGRTIEPAVELIGDLRETLPVLLEHVETRTHPSWWQQISQWARTCDLGHEAEISTAAGPAVSGRTVSQALAAHISRVGAVVATDVGQHQMWIAQELGDARPRTHLTSGGLGTMGYALPAAIGAAVADRSRSVWAVAGDGGFQMTMQELGTLMQERLAVKVAIVNNGYLGMVRQWQELYYDGRYSASAMVTPDFAQVAEAYGIPARIVCRAGEVPDALEWAEAAAGPVVLELRVAAEENVYPLVPPGCSLSEMQVAPVPAPAS